MASPHSSPRRQHGRRGHRQRQRIRQSLSGGRPPPSTTGRRASLLVLACSIPFAVIVLVWQHARLMDRLEGGGEYYAAYYSNGEDDDDEANDAGGMAMNWGESVQQAVDVVKFVAYGSGLIGIDDSIDDDQSIDEGETDDIGDTENSIPGEEPSPKERSSSILHAGSIIPFDLSVNHLRPIVRAPGRPPSPPLPRDASSANAPPEDFLPVVMAPEDVTFRWRHRPAPGSHVDAAGRIGAYRIQARRGGGHGHTGTGEMLWDSGTVEVAGQDELPHSIPWPAADEADDEPKTATALKAGTIVEWRVVLWDAAGGDRSSGWSRFAVGPGSGEGEWRGKWIVHPSDMAAFDRKNKGDECEQWRGRRPLPLFRAQFSSKELFSNFLMTDQGGEEEEDPLASALLVVSGLGSFRASFDGVPLSPSGPIDPPFTDYTKRVMYRGFDVTPFLVGNDGKPRDKSLNHAIGITTGSGWWDHRPLASSIVKFDLLPRGPVAVVAQLYLVTSKGHTQMAVATAAESTSWEVTRGHIRESDLFTGEIVDVGVMSDMEGWDARGRSGVRQHGWVSPVAYRTDITPEDRRGEMAVRAQAKERGSFKRRRYDDFASPIGKLVPSEIPPVLPMERIAPDEVRDLGQGRWLLDFGRAFSGVLHFDMGLPTPIVPDQYPRAHGFEAATGRGDSFITVVYGESLEMTTGDVNRVLVAGMGLHDGGPRHVSNSKGEQDNAKCFPDDHDGVLSQRDVFVFPGEGGGGGDSNKKTDEMISRVRQSHFTTHAFRFAEICCTATPPAGVTALLYRTAHAEWGTFDSSNVLLNGGYELVKNAMMSNMLSVQSDCPHREKLPYGGDLVADSPAAMHMFDMSAFYKKTVRDWMDAQWGNGAYTETSIWQDLNDYAGIGKGAGETVWATAPPVITVRHMQHYGDIDFLRETWAAHGRWLSFLTEEFDRGMEEKGMGKNLMKYTGEGSGLGDWLALRGRDTYITHAAFYMAAARCVAFIANKLGERTPARRSMAQANMIRRRIAMLYMKNGRDTFDFPLGRADHTPGPELGLFSRIVPGEKRCAILKNWFRRSGSTWSGDEETLFLKELPVSRKEEMVRTGELTKDGDEYSMGWSQWQGFNEGIFGIRYALKTLSDFGFHHIALRKAAGFGFGTPEYMLRHNATTMWESWWRSEDLYSRNHPMLGALAEWMPAAVAGVALHPTTVGGRRALFWPRLPRSAAMLEYASAMQGSAVGDYAIAWRFEDLPEDKSKYDSAYVKVRIRVLVPPGGAGTLRLPVGSSKRASYSISKSATFPDLSAARREADAKCLKRRRRRLGFPFSWEYDRAKKSWYKMTNGKSIGTPCESFLFGVMPLAAQWTGGREDATDTVLRGEDRDLPTGFYEVVIDSWRLEPEVEGNGRLGNIPEYFRPGFNGGPYCADKGTFEWDIDDATHII